MNKMIVDKFTQKRWLGVESSLDKGFKQSDEAQQALVNQTVLEFVHYLKLFLPNLKDYKCELYLHQDRYDSSLERGINECGLFGPDYGKEYLGMYFAKIIILIRLISPMKRSEENKLESEIINRTIKYWTYNVTPYSNWEFSHKADNPTPLKERNRTAQIVNFPYIEVDYQLLKN